MKKYDIVIARYNENISWLDQLDQDKYNFVIYNKGDENISRPYITSHNPGHGSESFIRYIVEHYDNFPEFVIFVQGHPFDHCVDIIEKINNHSDDDLIILSDHFLTESISGWYEHLIKRPEESSLTTLREVVNIFLGDKTPQRLRFSAGEQYIVRSSFLKNSSKELYQKILERYTVDYLLPWHMERLYLVLWNLN